MNKCRFKNQEQLSARLAIIFGKHIFQIGTHALFVAYPKAIAFSTENYFRISAEDQSTSSLRKCEIKVWSKSAVDWCQLLPHKCRFIDLCLTGSRFFSSR